MSIIKAVIDGKLYNVITPTEYFNNSSIYPPSITAIDDGDMILPLRSRIDKKSGVVFDGIVYRIQEEFPGDLTKYLKCNLEIHDLGDNKSVADLLRKQQRIDQINKETLVGSDNIYHPFRNDDDSPEMILFKDAVEAKSMDIDKYIPRYESTTGSKFNNDKRLLNASDMTIKKMKGFAKAFDMKITMSIEDNNPEVANPMGEVFTMVITDDD